MSYPYHIRSDCRLCGCADLQRVLDLPDTPLANEFPKVPGEPQEEFPLYLVACRECHHVQLPVVVDPGRLFRDYVYVSGTSPVFVQHFDRYADEMCEAHSLDKDDLVVEIGSNDGTLLRFFKESGLRVLGIDPAFVIASEATEKGIETWPNFFDDRLADRILATHGPARLVVANNVFAHADDLAWIARHVKRILEPTGAFVFEVSYLVDVLKGTLFDTIYHEHLSFHSVTPLIGFFDRLDMSLVDAHRVDTHGGSIRVTVRPEKGLPQSIRTAHLLAEERELGLSANIAGVFACFEDQICQRRRQLRAVIEVVKRTGGRVAAFGAPAKATTLIRTFGIEDQIDFVVDDSPHKQGRWLPGGKIPVVPMGALDKGAPDEWLRRGPWPQAVVILAWNFAESILKKLEPYRMWGGECIVPLPEVRVVRQS